MSVSPTNTIISSSQLPLEEGASQPIPAALTTEKVKKTVTFEKKRIHKIPNKEAYRDISHLLWYSDYQLNEFRTRDTEARSLASVKGISVDYAYLYLEKKDLAKIAATEIDSPYSDTSSNASPVKDDRTPSYPTPLSEVLSSSIIESPSSAVAISPSPELPLVAPAPRRGYKTPSSLQGIAASLTPSLSK